MRKRQKRLGIKVQGISGTYVVTLGINATKNATKGLLGFAIHRTDHTENEQYWLRGFKTFKETEPDPVPGALYSTREHPVQTFLWGDYTAKPEHTYSYRVVPVYGQPKNLREGKAASVRISTESEDEKVHAVYFNRGAAASQAYARKFGNKKPHEYADGRAFRWLSRGLEEALLEFIGQAKGASYGLRAAVYEFNYEPVLKAFKAASESGADVQIVYDSRKENPKVASDRAVESVGIRNLMIRRTRSKSYISHNKFIVLLRNGSAVSVWTGSTNFTRGGIFGQTNVGHIMRDETVAEKYLRYWHQLEKDPDNKELRLWIEQETPDPTGAPDSNAVSVLFSPRKTLNTLHWYAESMDGAGESVNLTAAFGVNPLLAAVLGKDKDYLRYLLLERTGKNYKMYSRDEDVRISVGSKLGSDYFQRWLKEELTNYNLHVKYIHTKFMLIDPLSRNPTVISGSANFSDASTKNNDENMLVIQGNTRVADIYLGEFMRLFNHFYFRYVASLQKLKPESEKKSSAFLTSDDSWAAKYYEAGSVKEKQRLLFA